MPQYTINPEHLKRLRSLNAEIEELRDMISNDIVRQSGFAVGDLVEDKLSGHRYRIKAAWGFEHTGYGNISLRGKREWKTGRKAGRTARSETWLRASDLVIIEHAGE